MFKFFNAENPVNYFCYNKYSQLKSYNASVIFIIFTGWDVKMGISKLKSLEFSTLFYMHVLILISNHKYRIIIISKIYIFFIHWISKTLKILFSDYSSVFCWLYCHLCISDYYIIICNLLIRKSIGMLTSLTCIVLISWPATLFFFFFFFFFNF